MSDLMMEPGRDVLVENILFSTLAPFGPDALAQIVKNYGIVYVTSITRDECDGCEEQRPLFEALARKIEDEHPATSKFTNVHVTRAEGRSFEDRKIFRHLVYPTYIVNVKSPVGILEAFRSVYPKMQDVEEQIVGSIEVAAEIKKDSQRSS